MPDIIDALTTNIETVNNLLQESGLEIREYIRHLDAPKGSLEQEIEFTLDKDGLTIIGSLWLYGDGHFEYSQGYMIGSKVAFDIERTETSEILTTCGSPTFSMEVRDGKMTRITITTTDKLAESWMLVRADTMPIFVLEKSASQQ